MRIILVILLGFGLALCGYAHDKLSVKQSATWVESINVDYSENLDQSGAFFYLLSDKQVNIDEESRFYHYAIKINNAKGLEDISQVDVNFDPSFQFLDFHYIRIVRAGKYIDKLNLKEVMVLQREQRMERLLYDGSLSAILNLSDLRVGDVLEYAYTLRGFNPINKGEYSASFYLDYSIEVLRNVIRVLSPVKLNTKQFNDAQAAKVKKSPNGYEYIWDYDASKHTIYEDKVPTWFIANKRILMSSFGDWKEVVDWALPLYEFDSKDFAIKVKELGSFGEPGKGSIEACIQFVQDEVRYLGFESGISAYKPHNPELVLNQRYGDCKDKSLLLVAMLRNIGIEAYPTLVNTERKEKLIESLPSFGAFNHCVVNLKHEGIDYFIDPTVQYQRGDLHHMSQADYDWGLLIKEGESQLTAIARDPQDVVTIKEYIKIDEIGKGATVDLITSYRGYIADQMRARFEESSTANIQESYLEYYSALYKGVSVREPLRWEGEDARDVNEFVTHEYYHVDKIWETDSSAEIPYQYVHLEPLFIEDYMPSIKSTKRNMPLYLRRPLAISQETLVKMPEEWTVKSEYNSISGDGFSYNVDRGCTFDEVKVIHNYEINKRWIKAENVADLVQKHDRIDNELVYWLTYGDSGASAYYDDLEYDEADETGTIIGVIFVLLVLAGKVGLILGIVYYSRRKKRKRMENNDFEI